MVSSPVPLRPAKDQLTLERGETLLVGPQGFLRELRDNKAGVAVRLLEAVVGERASELDAA